MSADGRTTPPAEHSASLFLAPKSHIDGPKFNMNGNHVTRRKAARRASFHRRQAAPTFPGCVRGIPGEARTVRAQRVPQPRKEYPVRVHIPRPSRRAGLDAADEAAVAPSSKHNSDSAINKKGRPRPAGALPFSTTQPPARCGLSPAPVPAPGLPSDPRHPRARPRSAAGPRQFPRSRAPRR